MPTVFGVEHFLYLLFVVLLFIITLWLIQRFIHTQKQVDLLIKFLGFVLFLSILWNRLSIALLRDGFSHFIPGSFCGATSLFFSIFAMTLKRNHPIFHSITYVALLGGLLTLIYPDFIGQASSIFYPMTISGLWHHTVMFLLAIVMIKTGYITPEVKKWVYLPIGLSFYMTFGVFLISVLGYSDAMYIYSSAIEGTIFNWLVIGVIFLPLHLLVLLFLQWLQRKKPSYFMVR